MKNGLLDRMWKRLTAPCNIDSALNPWICSGSNWPYDPHDALLRGAPVAT